MKIAKGIVAIVWLPVVLTVKLVSLFFTIPASAAKKMAKSKQK